MGLILRYGLYSHSEGEAEVLIDRRGMFNQARHQYGIVETWTIKGFLQASTQALLTIAIADLKTAYARQGQNVALYQSDGTTLTNHYLTGTSLIGGVRVIRGPSFSQGKGGEYSTFRSYEIVLEAEFEINEALVRFNESISFSGGGPRNVFLQPIVGLPQKQQVASATPFRAVQTGSAVGLLAWPTPPLPLWPFDEDIDQRQINYDNPERIELGAHVTHRHFPVKWTYVFTAVGPMAGRPGYWI